MKNLPETELFVECVENKIERRADEESYDGINGIMRLDIDSGNAHQDEERQEEKRQFPLLREEKQELHYRAASHMAAWECCRRPFTGMVCALHEMIEESVLVARHGKASLTVHKVVAGIRKESVAYVLYSRKLVVIDRTRDRDEVEDDVECEEGRKQNERRTKEILSLPEEIVE